MLVQAHNWIYFQTFEPIFPMKHICLLLFTVFSYVLSAQTSVGLVAYYPFNNSFADATGNSANAGLPEGMPGFGCGAISGALRLDGVEEELKLLGPVAQEFDTEDFTLSFFFKAVGNAGTQYLVSKRRSDCTTDNAFYIRYAPITRVLNIFIGENQSKSISFVEKLSENTCWYQVTIVRQGTRVRFYLNGQLRQEANTSSRINLSNNGGLIIGNSACPGPNEARFDGLIDEFRVYYRALNEIETRELYIAPDAITNRDTLIYLGGSVQINISNTCATDFSWNPPTGVTPPIEANAVIIPPQAGLQKYTLSFFDNISTCIAMDTIRINVIDPDSLNCSAVYLPKAFTPNNDGLNETYGISNPFAISQLISFEIFDRWGGRVFFTADPFLHWDGYYKGEVINPGVLLYRVKYVCEGQEREVAGSVTVLR